MLVSRDKLIQYDIASDLYFSRRTGKDEPISRDQFFIDNPSRLIGGLFCAIGNDTEGWELEQFNGLNWKIIEPDSNYSLIITTKGLAALADIRRGGFKLTFSGIKIINRTILHPDTPIINWTDIDLLQAGEVVFAVGTIGSKYQINPSTSKSYLSEILKWRFNTSAGGLQYILTLPAEGFGSESDSKLDSWEIGAIGLYVKDPNNNIDDILFGVASLPKVITKYSTTVNRTGNTIKFYFNTILNNLGVISDLKVLPESDRDLPEVPNESLLLYPTDETKRPFNCYLVDSLNGTGIPALAVPKTDNPQDLGLSDWAFFTPSDNAINLTKDDFDDSVKNYMFTYWNAEKNKYCLAEGIKETSKFKVNEKTPVGIRVGNSVVFQGEIINRSKSYMYDSPLLIDGGSNYDINDELLIPTDFGLTFKVRVTAINAEGAISDTVCIGPFIGNVEIPGEGMILSAIYDPRSPLPRYGIGAKFKIKSTSQPALSWNFPTEWYNKPLYCDEGLNAGKATNIKTDSFIGWCTGSNSLMLSLDLRNRASETNYGITRYASNDEVANTLNHNSASIQTSICPRTLKDNFLQTSLPINKNQTGSELKNPINVESYVRFDKTILGSGTKAPYDNPNINENINDSGISFYGTAFRAYWADLAEFYESDRLYQPGTLITMGKGEKEISIATKECNGIISTKPGYQLGEKKSDLHLPVALTGRVPVLMDGNCMPKFGDKIYLSRIKPGHASTIENGKCLGKIIEKNFGTSNTVECVVRIDF